METPPPTVEQRSADPINYKAWAQNAVAFIAERGLNNAFSDWCGGWPVPFAPARLGPDALRSPTPPPDVAKLREALARYPINGSFAHGSLADYADQVLAALASQDAPSAPPSDEVGRVAMALHAVEESWNDYAWEHVPEGTQAEFRKQARAAIAALQVKP